MVRRVRSAPQIVSTGTTPGLPGLHPLQMPPQWHLQALRQWHDRILAALSVPHHDQLLSKVHIRDPRPLTFHQPHTSPVHAH